jgi:glucan endo-1,3-alpha-glucosidase
MIGGISNEHVRKDIVDAKNLGLDGFAMNYDQFDWWSNDTVDFLFNNADELKDFKLFFSFDHAAKHFPKGPSQYADYLAKYITRPSYLYFKGKPLVSTFGGENIADGDWAAFKTQVKNKVNRSDFPGLRLVPGFYQNITPSAKFFDGRGSIDGIFNWNSWQPTDAGKVPVSTVDDKKFQAATVATSKTFMMGMSPIQFKHMDKENNWYRRGEENLEYRFGQVLDLQPDIVQLQTWNDAGEGHYMGNIWPEPMSEAPKIQALVQGFDHTGYWQILPSFIKVWKAGDRTTANMLPTNGKTVQGAFWHHTLTVGADCSADELIKSPDILKAAHDTVFGVILVPRGKAGLVGVVNVGSRMLNKTDPLKEGYNSFKFTGLTPGKVQLEVWDGSTMVGRGIGPIDVKDKGPLCNYNFQVVGFPS